LGKEALEELKSKVHLTILHPVSIYVRLHNDSDEDDEDELSSIGDQEEDFFMGNNIPLLGHMGPRRREILENENNSDAESEEEDLPGVDLLGLALCNIV